MRGSSPYLEPRQPRWRASVLGPVSLVTAASGQVVTTAEAKSQLRVEVSDDDTLIDGYVVAAQEWCERSVPGGRQLLTATYDVPAACWWEGPLRLPLPPLQSVTSVKYYDAAGAEQTLAATEYLVRTPRRQPGTVERAPGKSWPALEADRRLPVTVRFVAGYGAAAAVPQLVKQAVLMLAAHWYEHREAAGQAPAKEVDLAVRALLAAAGWGAYG